MGDLGSDVPPGPSASRRLRSWRPPLAVRTVVVLGAATLVWVAVDAGLDPFFGNPPDDRLGHALRAVLTAVLAVPLVVLARRHLDARPWAGLALTPLRSGGLRSLLSGAAFWLGAAAVGTAVTIAAGGATIAVVDIDAQALLVALYLPVLVLLFEALPEELIFRGYLYRNLADRFTRWTAVTGQAALFTVWGTVLGAAGSVDRVLLFFSFSLALGALRVVAGSVWAPIGFHLAFQWVSQYLGAPDGAFAVDGRGTLDVVAMWLFPIALGTVVLVVAGARRGVRWSERDPDGPVPVPATS
ncbi:lysostaphin resistance A-like protein [Pseudonocardia xinjiangensis]|uniref:CPBP family intramembrane glutamic endopeptidase n=1 Tax=Pseudonocardia xinjiangensis TaxID=75289 RepID=UPI003D912CA1